MTELPDEFRATKRCDVCGHLFERINESAKQWARHKSCSIECRFHIRGVERVIAGEYRIHTKGYIQLFVPWHPSSRKGYVYEHRLVMERHLDRLLRSDEIVHHINDDPVDNRLENLEVVSAVEHKDRHAATPQAVIVELLQRGLTGVEIRRRHKISTHRLSRITRGVREGTIR